MDPDVYRDLGVFDDVWMGANTANYGQSTSNNDLISRFGEELLEGSTFKFSNLLNVSIVIAQAPLPILSPIHAGRQPP